MHNNNQERSRNNHRRSNKYPMGVNHNSSRSSTSNSSNNIQVRADRLLNSRSSRSSSNFNSHRSSNNSHHHNSRHRYNRPNPLRSRSKLPRPHQPKRYHFHPNREGSKLHNEELVRPRRPLPVDEVPNPQKRSCRWMVKTRNLWNPLLTRDVSPWPSLRVAVQAVEAPPRSPLPRWEQDLIWHLWSAHVLRTWSNRSIPITVSKPTPKSKYCNSRTTFWTR
mmetsp:Transcript_25221/g.55296  ORF Transcript_25221/g.55296 Transcript_25221/m.55296 type:complete len:221 (-) Transcript_25221:1341-2003(-)